MPQKVIQNKPIKLRSHEMCSPLFASNSSYKQSLTKRLNSSEKGCKDQSKLHVSILLTAERMMRSDVLIRARSSAVEHVEHRNQWR